MPVAKWIEEQSAGKTRLVHIGRPWAPLEWFDLIITTPQYGLPARPNVLHNTLPLHHVDFDALARSPEVERWEREIAALPKPRIAVLVGGSSPSYVLDPATGTISGTPLAPAPPTLHTVTASNATGSADGTVTIAVEILPAPCGLAYAETSVVYTWSSEIAPNVGTIGCGPPSAADRGDRGRPGPT